jgi:hypothetical protein
VTSLTVLKEKSNDACQYFGNGTIDFLMIDGDHSYEGVTSDIKNYFYKMKPGGFISGDDYNVFDSTTQAVNDFSEELITYHTMVLIGIIEFLEFS